MKLKQLEIFAAVAKHQNLTRAAELLRVSQPAVSKGLKLLEEHLNTVLHRRNGHGIQLTDEGWRFLPQVDAFLKDRDRLAKNFITGRNHERSESFVIGASYGPSASLVPSIMAVFQKNHPHIQLDLRTDNREVIEKLLLKLEIEIAVVANKGMKHRVDRGSLSFTRAADKVEVRFERVFWDDEVLASLVHAP